MGHIMEKLSDELVEIRMGEPLETMLQKAAGKRSMFSLDDMTDIVRMYDAVKQLNITLFGHNEYHGGENVIESISALRCFLYRKYTLWILWNNSKFPCHIRCRS